MAPSLLADHCPLLSIWNHLLNTADQMKDNVIRENYQTSKKAQSQSLQTYKRCAPVQNHDRAGLDQIQHHNKLSLGIDQFGPIL